MKKQGGRWDFYPFKQQRDFLEATEPEVLYSGAMGAGKSRAGCEKAVFLAQRYPGNEVLICRRYFSDLPSTTLKTLLEEVLPPSHVIHHHKTEHWIRVRCHDGKSTSTIWYRGLDRATGIASMNLGAIFYDEAIEGTEEQWAMLEGRLRLNRVPFHQIFSATNPGPPSHWLYKRFFHDVPKDPTGKPLRRAVTTTALDNPHNPPSYRDRLQRFAGVFHERFVLGKWIGFEGIVLPEFDPSKHIVPRFEIPSDWPRYRAIDYGTVNPTVCWWFARNPSTDQLVGYREWYMSGRRMVEHARRIKELSGGENYQVTLSDHDATERIEFEREGIRTQPARKDVQDGLQKLKNRLSINPETGKPGLVFFEDALVEVDRRLEMENKPTRTVDEIPNYRWATGTHGVFKDVPMKKDDHGIDTTRYLVVEVDGRGKSYGVATHLKEIFS